MGTQEEASKVRKRQNAKKSKKENATKKEEKENEREKLPKIMKDVQEKVKEKEVPKNEKVKTEQKLKKEEEKRERKPGAKKEQKEKVKKDKPSRKPKGPRKSEKGAGGRKKSAKKPVKSAIQKTWEEWRPSVLHCLRRHGILIICTISVAMLLVALYFASDTLDTQKSPDITEKVTFQFAINGTDIGSVELGLYGGLCPLTTQNFKMLATHEKGFGYKGSNIHTVIPMHFLVGGDITNGDGSGGQSALGMPFENENFQVQHSGPGYLGMLALEGNRNSSRSSIFYITINAMPRLDRSSVAFGKVTKGMEVIKQIEAAELDDKFIPYGNITITDASYEVA